MRQRSPTRAGQILLQVLAFVVVFLVLLGVTFRQMASALRVQAVRTQQSQRDQGSVVALGLGMTLLETGLPPTDPYSCQVTLTTPSGPVAYVVTFTAQGSGSYAVSAAPAAAGDSSPAMPTAFFPASVP